MRSNEGYRYSQDIFLLNRATLFSAFRKSTGLYGLTRSGVEARRFNYGDMQICTTEGAYLVLTSYPKNKTLAVPLDAT